MRERLATPPPDGVAGKTWTLTALHSGLGTPLPIAVTVGYACAFALSYFLNRTMNFRSHAPVGPQVAIYVAVVVVNYLAFILGVSSVLAGLGLALIPRHAVHLELAHGLLRELLQTNGIPYVMHLP